MAQVLLWIWQSQAAISEHVPLMQNKLVYIGFLVLTVALPALYLLSSLFGDKVKRPPRFNYLVPALQGKFEMQKTGPLGLVQQGFNTLGEVFSVKVFNRNVIFLVGPEAVEPLFTKSDDEVDQRDPYKFTVPVFGKGIVFDADPKVMIQQLKFVKGGLNGVNMPTYCAKIVEETEAYFKQKWIKDEDTVDLYTSLSELIILTASRCLLGDELRAKMDEEVAELYQDLSDGMTHLTFFFPSAPTAAHRKRDAARARMSEIFTEVIQNRRKHPEIKHEDFLQVLIEAEYRDGSKSTDDEIVGLLLGALFAGQHTSNITSTWTGLHMIHHKEKYWQKLVEEQKEVLEANDGEITLKTLGEMNMLHACMQETLRLYPPLIMLMRKVMKSFEYKGYTIPEGDLILAVPPVSHRVPSVYSNPETFDPERFARGEGQGKFEFIAFGGGRHTCLGERFAYLQIKTIWSYLLRHFEFDAVEPFPEVDHSHLVAGPHYPCMVKYRRLKQVVA